MNKQVESARIILRNKLLIPLIKNNMNKKLINKDFTIISNNCWGGTIYELYNLRNQTPTVGMFIMPRDYIKFLKNLRFYLNQSLVFIRCDESKWKTELEKKSNWSTYLVKRCPL